MSEWVCYFLNLGWVGFDRKTRVACINFQIFLLVYNYYLFYLQYSFPLRSFIHYILHLCIFFYTCTFICTFPCIFACTSLLRPCLYLRIFAGTVAYAFFCCILLVTLLAPSPARSSTTSVRAFPDGVLEYPEPSPAGARVAININAPRAFRGAAISRLCVNFFVSTRPRRNSRAPGKNETPDRRLPALIPISGRRGGIVRREITGTCGVVEVFAEKNERCPN